MNFFDKINSENGDKKPNIFSKIAEEKRIIHYFKN